jgi:hypothetical protein
MVSNFINKLIVRHLESLISEIKTNAFDKVKNEVDGRNKIKFVLANNVDVLQNTLNVVKSQKKLYGNANTKLLNENDRLMTSGEVK